MDEPVKRGRPKLVKLSPRGRPRQIRPAALHGVLVEHLRHLVQTGELAPGEPIVETELSEQLGVSRTPLREALKVLSSEGLVELRPHRTPIVAPVDPAEIAAIFEVLEGLESVAGRRACENMTDNDLADLEAMHTAMNAEHERDNRAAYQAQNRDIHFRIVELTRNPVLKATYAKFMIQIVRARGTNNYDPARWMASQAEHEMIMRAFRARDPERVSAALVFHTRETGASVIARLLRFAEPKE